VSGLEFLGKAECLLHAGRRLIQVANHEAAMHHDARFPAATDKAVRLFVILRVATVIVVLLHAIDDFHVATLEPDAE
jgi:hypothetical protein